MPILLHIEASPRGERSASTALATPFVDTFAASGWTIDHLPLWRADLPEFDGAMLDAKYARLAGKPHDPEQARAWANVEALVDRLRRADRLLLSTPMWNFGIPYKLKHWIDLITQPGLSFSFDPATGYTPLLAPRPVTVILASAGDYREGPSWGRPDLASDYLHAALAFIGLTDAEIVHAGPTIGDPQAMMTARLAATARLSAIAAEG